MEELLQVTVVGQLVGATALNARSAHCSCAVRGTNLIQPSSPQSAEVTPAPQTRSRIPSATAPPPMNPCESLVHQVPSDR